jgi:chemotaxis protein methyltransferase CheR
MRTRLEVRLKARGVPSFRAFHDEELVGHPEGSGMQLLVDLTTINHSAFFREPVQLRALAEHLAGLVRCAPAGGLPVRVWSAGCAAGQEPYSLAMLMAELNPAISPSQLEIWASDVSLEVVREAAGATYGARVVAEIPPERLRRFFLRGRGSRQGQYRVAPEVRRLVRFRHFDLRRPDWPEPDDFDAILCRNVAIYFSEAEQGGLMGRLARRLRPGGWLVVGNGEILPGVPGMLEKIAPAIFRRMAT